MALTKDLHYKGLLIKDAYIVITSFCGNKSKIQFIVAIRQRSDLEDIETYYRECDYNLSGGNVLEQAYNHLKTLPEFSDAVDC